MSKTILITIVVIIAMVILGGFAIKWLPVIFANDYDSMLQSLYSHTVPVKPSHQIDNLQDFTILDTRAPEEYQVSHLQGAIWVGYEDPALEKVADLPKDTPILVYCSVGYRSEKIGELLQQKGFTQVYNLYGGIFQWANEGRTIYDTAQQKTNAVHPYSSQWGKWLNDSIDKRYE